MVLSIHLFPVLHSYFHLSCRWYFLINNISSIVLVSAAYSNCWWCFGNHYQELPRITHSRFKVHWSPISHQFFLFSLLLGWWLLILVLFLVYYSWCDRLTEQWVIYLSDNRLNKLFSLNCWGLKHLSDTSINLICRLCQGLTSLTICDNPLMTEQSLIPIIAMLTSLQNLNVWGCNNLSTCVYLASLLLLHSILFLPIMLCYCWSSYDLFINRCGFYSTISTPQDKTTTTGT